MDEIIVKIAASEAELAGHFAVRRAIFVEEQRLFAGTDVDEHDRDAILIVALDQGSGAIVGAVRCYPGENGTWYGGRLALLKSYRRQAQSIGAELCRVAEATVIARGCREFLAYIQLQNVGFFERLGWQAIGEPLPHCGEPHQLMAASLAVAPEHSRLSEQVYQSGTGLPPCHAERCEAARADIAALEVASVVQVAHG